MTERSLLRAGAVTLVVVAAAGNVGHTYDHARAHGQAPIMSGIVSILPDLLIILCIIRLQMNHRNVWAWVGVAGSTAFVEWASVATSTGAKVTAVDGTGHEPGSWIVASFPLFAAIVATGMLHMPRAENAPDQPVPDRSSRVHVQAGLRVDVERSAERPDRVVVDVVPERVPERVPVNVPAIENGTVHATEPVPRPSAGSSPRDIAYTEWLAGDTTWTTERILAELGTPTPKAAAQLLVRWRQRAEKEAAR